MWFAFVLFYPVLILTFPNISIQGAPLLDNTQRRVCFRCIQSLSLERRGALITFHCDTGYPWFSVTMCLAAVSSDMHHTFFPFSALRTAERYTYPFIVLKLFTLFFKLNFAIHFKNKTTFLHWEKNSCFILRGESQYSKKLAHFIFYTMRTVLDFRCYCSDYTFPKNWRVHWLLTTFTTAESWLFLNDPIPLTVLLHCNCCSWTYYRSTVSQSQILKPKKSQTQFFFPKLNAKSNLAT